MQNAVILHILRPSRVVFPVVLIAAVSAYLRAYFPAAGDVFTDTLSLAGLLLNVALVAWIAILVVAVAAWNFGKGIRLEVARIPFGGLLPAGWAAPDIAPDVIICSQAGETPEAFTDRMNAAIEHATSSRWVVAMRIGSPVLLIHTGSDIITCRRDEEIFVGAAWEQSRFSRRIAEPGTQFTAETADNFRRFVDTFAEYYREWAPMRKAEMSAGRGNVPLDIVRLSPALSVALPFILSVALSFGLSVPVFAQSKSAQVAECVGTRIRQVPDASTEVQYIFENKTYTRIADGVSNYVDLLKKEPGLRSFNDNGGILVAVVSAGQVVCRADQTGDVSTQRAVMRPYSETREVDNVIELDSAGMARQAEEVKRQIGLYSSAAWKAARPWWGVVMFVFWMLFPVFAGAAGLAYLAARAAANEGMRNAHRGSRRILFWLLMTSAVLLYVNVIISMVYMELGPFWITVVVAAMTGVAYFIITALVPDFSPAIGNSPTRGLTRIDQ